MKTIVSALVLVGASLAAAEERQPTDDDLARLPGELGRMETLRRYTAKQVGGRLTWPVTVVYKQNGVEAAKLQCWDEDQGGACKGRGRVKVKLGTVAACYTPPDSDGGAMVVWFDGLGCSLLFKEASFDKAHAKQELAQAVTLATEAVSKMKR